MNPKPATLQHFEIMESALENWITLSKNEEAALKALRNSVQPHFSSLLPSTDLQPEHIPLPVDGLFRIEGFAATFQGYEYTNDASVLLAAANALKRRYFHQGNLPAGLSTDELRALLFIACRTSRHATELENEQRLAYVHYLLLCLLKRVSGK